MAMFFVMSAFLQASPTGLDILKGVDDVLYSAKDKDMKMRFVLIEKNGKESNREMETLEKGADKRFMRFISPADQKGIAFLSLPDNIMYIYLPAFGKTRRIATHVKNSKFAGTDLTYENLEAKRFSNDWIPELLSENESIWQLKLMPKQGVVTDYSYLTVKVNKSNNYPTYIEYYNKKGVLCKIMERNKVTKEDGKYWEAKETLVTDVLTGHKTRLELLESKYDSGISDDKFTERYMTR
jgi:outer membrane lipoprotein-sorting protein